MKSKSSMAVVLLCLVVLYSESYAGEEKLALNDAISISLESNNRYKIAREKVREKNLKINEVWGELWPELGSSASATLWGADRGVLTGNDGQYELQIVQGTFRLNPGAFYNRLKAAREDGIIAVSEQRRLKADTTVNTINLFYRVLLAEEVVKLRADSVRSLNENRRVVEAGYKNGTNTKLAFLRAGVAAANENTRLINARRELEKAKSALNLHLGRDINSPIVLDTAALQPVPGAGDPMTGVKGSGYLGQYAELVPIALKNRPELLQITHRKEMYTDKVNENESVYLWPTFFVNGSFGATSLINPRGDSDYGDPTANMILNGINSERNLRGWNKSWNFTVGATYRWGALSPADASQARSRQYKSLSLQTDMEMEDFVRNVKLEIQDGLLTLDSALNSIQAQKGNISSAEESMRVATLQFKNGMIDNTELLNANVELSNARTMYIQSLYEFQTAKARLNRALGCNHYKY